MKKKYLRLRTIATVINPLVIQPITPGFMDLPKDYSGCNCGSNFEKTKNIQNSAPINRKNITIRILKQQNR